MKKVILTMLVIVAGWSMAVAQSRGGLRINEVMVQNESSMVDEYNQHSAWIELFNSTYGPLEISSVYLTTDPNQPKMYPVPLGDVLTRIPKRQHIIFWADGQPNKGTFHTNLRLIPGQDNWIGIYDANGETLIDEVTVPASLLPDTSYARKIDGVRNEANDADAWEVRDGSDEKYITPSSNNVIKDTNNKVDEFRQRDKTGAALTVMAMCIVFCALFVLCVCFMIISRIGDRIARGNKMKSQGLEPKGVARVNRPDHDSGEEIAAIAMALHDHFNAHDKEKAILTINKVKRAYSPWSSKIYSMRQIPERKLPNRK